MVAAKRPLQPWYLAVDAETGFSLVDHAVAVAGVRLKAAVAALQPVHAVAARVVVRPQAPLVVRLQAQRVVARLVAAMQSTAETLFMEARWLVDAEQRLLRHLR
jgi:hypothetical protein